MKIALLGPVYPYRGGIAHYTALLCETLCREHEVKLISYRRQYPAWLYPGKSDKESNGKSLQTLKAEYLLDSINPWTWFETARQIVKFNPALVVLQWWTAFWTPQYAFIINYLKRHLAVARVVLICHNSIEHDAGTWQKFAGRYILSRADLLITHGQAETQNLVSRLHIRGPIRTAFHPTYAPLAEKILTKSEARRKMDLVANVPVLLFFGFVRPYKGLGTLLEALSQVLKQKEVALLVAGEFWDDKLAYVKQIKNLGLERVVHLYDHYIDNAELPLYFGSADLVVTPYLSATGSGVVQLAYGFNRPVISSAVGSAVEVVDDGVNGKLVTPGDSAALARALLAALQPSELEKLSRNAVATKERFSWQRLGEIIVGSHQ